MEKRLFLAVGLSLMVVWAWSAMAPKPNLRQESSNITQIIENKEDTIYSENFKAPSFSSEMPPEISDTSTKSSEKTEILDSEKLNAEFSNIGATLNKVTIKEYDVALPLEGITSLVGYEGLSFVLDQVSEDEIVYSYESDDFKITKTYAMRNSDYTIEAGIEFYNKSDTSKLINASISSYSMEMSSLDKKGGKLNVTNSRDKSLNEYAISSVNGIHRKGGAFKFSSKEAKEEMGEVSWSGFRNRYFCAIIKPQYDTKGYVINPIDDRRLRVDIKSQEVTILPHSSAHFDSIIFVGPEKLDLLKEYGFGFEKIKKYYRFALFDGIAKFIGMLMQLIHRVVPNWGVCIMIISVVIYFSMYPLTMRGMLSMKRMQSLQPLIAGLKEKHKDSPQKMNKEMMELYKEHKVNPLGGCLPMLLQMPVFIGLYQVLWRSVSFKGAHFLWIKDLSQPDRLFLFPFKLPVLGNEFNLLPLIMVVVMFFQQKLTTKNMTTTDPAQAAQQKMMATIMPVFLGFIFYKFASGLTLYFTMFYFFSTFTQWKMSKATKVA